MTWSRITSVQNNNTLLNMIRWKSHDDFHLFILFLMERFVYLQYRCRICANFDAYTGSSQAGNVKYNISIYFDGHSTTIGIKAFGVIAYTNLVLYGKQSIETFKKKILSTSSSQAYFNNLNTDPVSSSLSGYHTYESSYVDVDCHLCGGSGKCSTCNGTGWFDNMFGLGKQKCPNCYGGNQSGKCSGCQGTGKRKKMETEKVYH